MAVQCDLSHYYRQREGAQELNPTLQSSELWTPLQLPQHPTVSPGRYQEYLLNSSTSPRLPWGREREYGGTGPVSLPADQRPKSEPPVLVVKGHKHYGYGGDPSPRGLPIEQYYDLTKLKKSAVRPSDELYPRPPSASINAKQIYLDFPAEHPYHSHISKFAVFPSFRPPDEPVLSSSPLPPQTPARGYPTIILKKTKGNPYRHEVIDISESQREALIWPGQEGYFQYPKFHQVHGQIYYPMPPKTVAPNPLQKSLEETPSERSVNLQRNLIKSQWLTSYSRSFTERGEMNPLQHDDFHEKIIGNITGQTDENTNLRQTFLSSILQARPLEGRTARIREGRRPLYGMIEELNMPPESQSSGSTSFLDSHEERHVLTQFAQCNNTDGDALDACKNSRSCIAEEELMCFSPTKRQHKEPDFHKITDTEQSEALYRRQLTPLPTTSVLDNTIKSMYYEDLQPSKKSQYVTFENPPYSSKQMMQEIDTIQKAQERHGTLHLYSQQNMIRTPTPAAMHDIGMVPPQTNLLELQDSFSKSEVHKDFYQHFPEKTKDLRENVYSGRKHKFYGFHSFYFHN
ncbi:sperm-associated microtubule inner protein 4 [Rhinophrynus dorsalis]